MNTIWHFVISFILVLPFGWKTALIVALGSILIDIDHLYLPISLRKTSKKQVIKLWRQETKHHRPHFFLFHTIEFIILFLITSYFINYYLFLIAIGFFLHLVEDIVCYILYYKSLKPWANYLSLIAYLSKK